MLYQYHHQIIRVNFITELARVSKATNPHLANPKAWLF
ncbi:hypothetical protein COO91_07475 [Nostoc flagelliforme CCNUN1]|uniref:Uncharacterized protein n=1 Tax=Nostoc flagelliforme CCNUN1 TaxID=2038116 RepID=A0A2K8T156_9NOSO|nr:hypothetical protein COO91_07475 [Nostoc flagelliforme CCNUN1]